MEPKIKTQLLKIKVNADEIRIKHQIVTHMIQLSDKSTNV